MFYRQDILVFLTGQEEILSIAKIMKEISTYAKDGMYARVDLVR